MNDRAVDHVLEEDAVAIFECAPGSQYFTTWLPIAPGEDIRAGDWIVCQEDGRWRPAVDGDGHLTKFRAITGRIPAGTPVSDDHPEGAP